jgi:hypothetical protein
MKKYFIIILLLMASCVPAHSQVYEVPLTHHLVHYECTICGADIWNCEKIPEKQSQWSGDYEFINGYDKMECWKENGQKDSKSAVITIGQGYVCPLCYKEYIDPLQQKFEKDYDAVIHTAIYVQTEMRKFYDRQRQKAEVNALKAKINDLQEQIDIKEGRKKPKTQSFIFNNDSSLHIMVDSAYILKSY